MKKLLAPVAALSLACSAAVAAPTSPSSIEIDRTTMAAGQPGNACVRVNSTTCVPIGTINPSGVFAPSFPPNSVPGSALNPAAATALGGVFRATAPAHQWETGTDPTGAPLFVQPSIADIAGLLGGGDLSGSLASPKVVTIGGVLPQSFLLPHVANVAALGAKTDFTQSVMRDDVGIVYADTGASCVNPDGFAQIAPAAGHCWTPIPGTRWNPRIWGATGGDDTAAWTKALAYVGSLGTAQTIYDDLPSSTINNTRLTLPANVAISNSGSPYEASNGALSTNLPAIVFAGNSAGLFMMPGSSIRGMSLFGAVSGNTTDHVLEFGGQVGLEAVRCYAAANCGLVTTTLNPSLSSVQVEAGGTGLTNGSYTNVAFTGAGGTGATMSVVVSGGAITSATISGGGTGYTNDAFVSLAANALYSGSPALSNFATISTAQMGRSRFKSVFIIGGAALVKGLQIGGAFDFVVANDIEIYAPLAGGSSIGMEATRVDGLELDNFKVFGIGGTAFLGDQPSTDTAHPFWSISNAQLDGVNVGFNITAPISQLTFSGGYTRSIGKSFLLNNPSLGVTVTGMNLLSQADTTLFAQDFNELSVTGNAFSSGTTYNTSAWNYVYITGNAGLGSYYVGSNAIDGNHPFFVADGAAKGGTVGPNNWPGRKYAATSGGNPTGGYSFTANTGANVVLPTTGGRASVTTDTNGQATIPYNLGSVSWMPEAFLLGAPIGYSVNIVSVGTESFVVRVTNASGAAATSSSFTIIWKA